MFAFKKNEMSRSKNNNEKNHIKFKKKKNTNNNQQRKRVDHLKKIESKSKIMKKTKTPAQDRLQKLKKHLIENRSFAESVENSVITELQSEFIERDEGKSNNPKLAFASASTSTSKSTLKLAQKQASSQHVSDSDEEIPRIFPLHTPAQNRLKQFQCLIASKNVQTDSTDHTHNAIEVTRKGFGIDTTAIDSGNQLETNSDIRNKNEEFVYIVPDTNIFIHDLNCLTNVIKKDKNTRVFVPYTVIEELDNLKSKLGKEHLLKFTTAAIKFINNEFKSGNRRIIGQQRIDDNKQFYTVGINNADDRILNCCLQLKGKLYKTLLLTNDTNLSNKAFIEDIKVMSSQEFKKEYNVWKNNLFEFPLSTK